jgi:hypothetical protein
MTSVRGSVRAALAVALMLGIGSGPLSRRADAAPCDPASAAEEAASIRAGLDRDKRNARWWDTGWAIGFGVATAAAVTLAATETAPLGEFDEHVEAGLYVGAVNSAIGMLGHLVLPMKIVRPGPPTGDGCADLAAAEAALRETGKHQKHAFYLNHLGGFITNAGALLVLGLAFDTWEEGAKAAGIGYPVSLLNTYTGPRASWARARTLPPSVSWQLIPVRRQSYTGLALTVAF